jgi:hypothetical protein
MTSPTWFDFQEEIKDYFCSIGADAETNKRLLGVRTSHDVDIFVQIKFLGEDLVWLVEAKHWNSPVTKLHVLSLRTIVDDTGADRGFIVSSAGFQKGAYEAADKTNVKLKTFDELKADTSAYVEAEILKTYDKRLTLIEDRYWSHEKRTRIQYGLRHELADFSSQFSGQQMLLTARAALESAKSRHYPIDVESFLKEQKGESIAHNFQQLINWLNLNLNHFDEKLLDAEWAMFKCGDYNPNTLHKTPEGQITTMGMAAKAMTTGGETFVSLMSKQCVATSENVSS